MPCSWADMDIDTLCMVYVRMVYGTTGSEKLRSLLLLSMLGLSGMPFCSCGCIDCSYPLWTSEKGSSYVLG